MNGFYGFINNNSLFSSLTRNYRANNWHAEYLYQNNQIAIGIASNKKPGKAYFHYDYNSVKIFFTGKIYNYDQVKLGEILYKYYNSNTLEEVKHLNGIFQICILDEKLNKFIIITDRYGFSKLYYYHYYDQFIFSFRYLPLLASIPNRQINHQSIQEFLTFQYILGEKTFTQDVNQTGTAAILEYDIRTQTLKKKKYWQFDFDENPSSISSNDPQILQKTYELWQSAVEKRIKDQNQVIIPLSGGKDSRAILAAALQIKPSNDIITFSYGKKRSYDFKIAKKVAAKAGVKNIEIPVEKSNFDLQFNNILEYHDGLFNALPSLPFDGFERIREYGDTIISGYIGDFIFGSNMPGNMLTKTINDESWESVKQLFQETNKFHSFYIIAKVINFSTEKYFPFLDKNEVRSISNTKLVNIFVQYFLQNHIYNFTYHTCPVYKHIFDYRVPFLDNNLIDFTLKLPVNERFNQKLYKKFLLKYYPNFFSISIKNDYGLKMNASTWKYSLKYNYYIKSIWRINKLSSLLLKFNILPDKTLNYLDYETMLRQKTDFHKFIEKSIQELNGELFNKNEIKQLYKGHQKGWVNHSYILSQIVTLDLFFKTYKHESIKS